MDARSTEFDGPVYAEFDVQRGDTDLIGAVLQQQDLFTGLTSTLSLDGRVAWWILVLPGGPLTKTTEAGGGLDWDPTTGALIWRLDATTTAGLPATLIRTLIRIVETSTGAITTWLDGYVVPRG